MKKIPVALTMLAAFVLAACVHENTEQFTSEPAAEANTLVFSLKGNISTRTAEALPATPSSSIYLGEYVPGQQFWLDETITLLDGADQDIPATRGTPVYTENINDMYKTMAVAHHESNKGKIALANVMSDVIFDSMEESSSGAWRYSYSYPIDPWPNPDKAYWFFFRMPAKMPGVTLKETGTFNTANGAIEFSYVCPPKAESQQDILFAARPLTKSDYETALKSNTKGASILFHHVLTGVKFALGNNNDGTLKTHVTRVAFRGLRDKGSCVYTPRTEDGGYVDKPDQYSSSYPSGNSLPATVNWTVENSSSVFTADFDASDQTIDNTVTYTKEDGQTVDNHGNKFANSFYEGGASRNLNTENAELTFWLIPQTIPYTAVLHVWFDVFDGTTTRHHELDLDLGARLADSGKNEWKAGELRTYTIKPNIVDIEITDEIEENIKSDVVITNTGNVSEYVRCLITANWVDNDGNIVVGYSTKTGNEFVEPWLINETGTAANFGTFSFLPGGSAAGAAKWEYSGGYYYFKDPIGPGEDLPKTTPLFKSYTYALSDVPTVWLVNPLNPHDRYPAPGVHLEMDISVQSVIAEGYDSYSAAWAAVETASAYQTPSNN